MEIFSNPGLGIESDIQKRQWRYAEAVEKQTPSVVALENQCRERGRELLQPILTDDPYKLLLAGC